MYIKWIVCEVKNNFKKEFSTAQEQWIETQNSVGFIGQVGGFDLKSKNIACIISFWENENSLKLFMKNIHDKIFLKNNQSEYYNSIRVDYFNSELKMEGEYDLLIDALNNSKFLRVADCLVKQEKTDHFDNVQKEVWLPEMKESKGMLGGVFSKNVNNTSHYLVSTFWSSSENHRKYVETNLQKLKIKSDVKNDIENVIGIQIILIDTWKIIKTTANKELS